MRIKILFLIGATILSFLLIGCTTYDGRPMVATYNPPPEYKLKSITHWNIIANDVASQIESTLQPTDTSSSPDQAKKSRQIPSLYILGSNATDFDKVFSSQLESSLLAKGFEVKSTPKDALTINFRVNAIRHMQQRNNVEYEPGTLTAIAAGVLVIEIRPSTTQQHLELLQLLLG